MLPASAVDPEIRQQWRENGYWQDISLDQALSHAAKRFADAPLNIHSDVRPAQVTLAELRKRGLVLAGALQKRGIGSGDVVALQLPNWIEAALVYQAAAAIGAVILPIVPIFGEAELGFILRDARARVLFIPGVWRGTDYVERVQRMGETPELRAVVVVAGDLESVAAGGGSPSEFLTWDHFLADSGPYTPNPTNPDAPAFMVYTSGTTANPKGVIHSSNSLLAEVTQSYPEGDDTIRVLSPYPAGHIAGALGVLAHLVAGRPTVLFDVWDPVAAVGYIESQRITSTAGTPYHYLGLLDAAEATNSDLSSLRACGTGGATVPESLVARAERLNIHLFRRYGMSEHPTVTQGDDSDPLDLRMTTDGRARPGVEVRIVDDEGRDVAPGTSGEVATRGPDMFMGYTDPEQTCAAILPGGWYLSGDIGVFDERQCLTIVDRKKDIIIRGGENISSREIEDLMLRIAGVAEAAAVGMPDERLGERVCIYIIVEPDTHVDLLSVQTAFASFGVARQKTPERVIVAQAFPRTAAGKIRKVDLRRTLRQEFAMEKRNNG
ncbi:AMP-binding protein [Parasphingorhabdus sp.]|uniref:AMP-binding protein n=1 Tax=Parasphingorhabdus sp. TaxID=2709688 RepID=UPI0030010351